MFAEAKADHHSDQHSDSKPVQALAQTATLMREITDLQTKALATLDVDLSQVDSQKKDRAQAKRAALGKFKALHSSAVVDMGSNLNSLQKQTKVILNRLDDSILDEEKEQLSQLQSKLSAELESVQSELTGARAEMKSCVALIQLYSRVLGL